MLLAGAKESFFEAAMVIVSPVVGLRPWRSARSITLKRPNPASVTSSPALAAAAIAANCGIQDLFGLVLGDAVFGREALDQISGFHVS
jgi:hypothetical protein